MRTDNLFQLRPADGLDPGEQHDSDLMGLVRSLQDASSLGRQRPSAQNIIIVTGTPARWDSPDLEHYLASAILVESPFEALDHLVHRQGQCVAVFTDMDLPGRDNGGRVVEAFRAARYGGPIIVVMTRDPLTGEKEALKRRGATGIVLFRSTRMFRMLEKVVGAMDQPSPGVSAGAPFPSWLLPISKQLARFVGPSAGEMVRRCFLSLLVRYKAAPHPADLIEEVAGLLSEWPDDRAHFMRVCDNLGHGAP